MGFWSWMRDNVAYPLGRAIKGAAQHVAQTIQDRFHYVAVMEELGWPPTVLTDRETQDLILGILGERKPREARAEIEAALLKHFDQTRLNALFNDWMEFELAAERRPILRQVIDGHLAGLHYLTVGAVHAQIDGLLSTVFRLQGRATEVSWKKLSKVLEGAPFPRGAHHVANQFLKTRVRVPFERGRPLASDHSRHAIAHGHDLGYGTPENSLKALLLFDYVVWAVRDLRLVEGDTYHKPTCLSISAHFTELDFIRNPLDLMIKQHRLGLRPCLACKADYFAPETAQLPANTRPMVEVIEALAKPPITETNASARPAGSIDQGA